MIKAIIFDMDDLMVNSHPVHMKVFEKVLKRYGADISELTPEEEASLFGKKAQDIFTYFIRKFNLPITWEQLNFEIKKELLPFFEKHIEAMPGLFEFLDMVKDYKLALASSSKGAKIDIVLKKFHLKYTFSVIVSGEDEIKHGKPAPDTFLKAAEKLNLKPEECLVLEDAHVGVLAAKAAGMHCIGVHNMRMFERLGIKQDLSKADLEVNSLSKISIESIKNL